MRDVADFVLVYIEEAHAIDEWPISSARYNTGHGVVAVKQPTTMAEREAAAKAMKHNLGCELPVALDGMDNEFSKQFSPWPFRFFVLHAGLVMFKAMPKDCTYDLGDVRDCLERFRARESDAAPAPPSSTAA